MIDLITRRRKNIIYYIIFITFIVFFLNQFIIYPNLISHKDSTIPTMNANLFFEKWDDNMFGHISLANTVKILYLLLTNIFGFLITNKIFFLSIFLLPFSTFSFMLKNSYKIPIKVGFIPSLLYSVNPVTLDFLWGGNGGYFSGIIYGSFPLILYFLKNIQTKFKFTYAIILIFLISFLIFNLWVLFPMVVAIFIFLLFSQKLPSKINFAKIFIIIVFASVFLGFVNMFFSFSRLFSFGELPVKTTFEWSYKNITPYSLLSLTFNRSNFFIYNICQSRGFCNFGIFYFSIFVFVSFFMLHFLGKFNKNQKKLILLSYFFISITLLTIYLIGYLVFNKPGLINNFLTILSSFRNPDKLITIYIFFLSLSFAFILNYLKNYYKLGNNILLFVTLITIISLSIAFIQFYDGFLGLSNFYLEKDAKNSIKYISLTKDDFGFINDVNKFNSNKDRVAIFPYCSTGYTHIDKRIANFVFNVAVLSSGGIFDGYNNSTVNTITDFYQAIIKNDTVKINYYSEILEIKYFAVEKTNDFSNNTSVRFISSPYICGAPENFIRIFKSIYPIVFENNNTIIFETISQRPILYALEYSTNNIVLINFTKGFQNETNSIVCNNCRFEIINSSEDILGYNLTINNITLSKVGNSPWHSVSFLVNFDDWQNYYRIILRKTGEISFIRVKDNKTDQILFYNINLNVSRPFSIKISKFGPNLEIYIQNNRINFTDYNLINRNELQLWLDNSNGIIQGINLELIRLKIIDYQKISSTQYKIFTSFSNKTLIVFSDSYNPLWSLNSKDDSIKSSLVYNSFNGFWLDTNMSSPISLEFTPQIWINYYYLLFLIGIFSLILLYYRKPLKNKILRRKV